MGPQGLVLGTVQLGTPYGIANRTGMPNEDQALDFITQAVEAGINCISFYMDDMCPWEEDGD